MTRTPSLLKQGRETLECVGKELGLEFVERAKRELGPHASHAQVRANIHRQAVLFAAASNLTSILEALCQVRQQCEPRCDWCCMRDAVLGVALNPSRWTVQKTADVMNAANETITAFSAKG